MSEPATRKSLLEAVLARRSVLPLVAFTAYACVAALRVPEAVGGRAVVFGLVAMGIAARAVWPVTRWGLWGVSLVVASIAAPGARGWLDVVGWIGAAVALDTGMRAMDEIPSPGGLASRRAPARWGALALGLASIALAIASALADAYRPSHWLGEHARGLAATGGVCALAAMLAHLARVAIVRRLELGVVPRARTAAVLVVAAAGAFGAFAAFGAAPFDKSMRVAIAIGALAAARVLREGDANAIARFGRRATVLVAYGGPVTLLGALAVSDAGLHAPVVAFVGALVALLLGTTTHLLERPLRPASGALMDAFDQARLALRRTDPEDAIREVLVAVREPAGVGHGSPELWTCDPGRVSTIDAAGYLHERAGAWPDEVARLAAAEPEATLRAEVLEALEVRRPDLRSALKWLRDRAALCATVVVRGGEPEGLVVVPQGTRGAALTWEEARALKDVADGLAAACHARSSLARSLARETDLQRRLEDADEGAERLRHELALHVGHAERMTTRLARAATVGIYSAASRMAFEAIERRVRIGAPLALLSPSGVDPVPYVARAHLGGPRAKAPLVLVDGTASREHDLERWRDPRQSPLALADGGMLVLLDGAALPAEVQRIVARALAERRPPWESPRSIDVVLAISCAEEPARLVAEGRLEESLAARLADALDAPVRLPALRDRAEDLRAILTDRLAREGLRVRGRPVGLDDAAFAILMEYPFPGEDAELASIVMRLVARCTGDVVRAADVQALGLHAALESPREARKGPRGV